MITASNIYLQYGGRILFDHINVVIGAKDRVGLVGRNGAGKSTFLKALAGELTLDEGTIARPSNTTMGFLHQEMNIPKGRTVMEETLTAFDELRNLEKQLEAVHKEIERRTDYESDSYFKLLEDFSHLNDRFHLLGGEDMEASAERVLKGLGFKAADFDRQTSEFSGGWQMRVELTKMLLQRPDYLLLDEPTNHLDIESIIWLEGFLKEYPGAIILISHDKQFLDNITTRTVEIELGKVFDYKASYSKYVELRRERREKLQSSFENQQRVIAQKEKTINRFMAKANKSTMAKSMQKQLNKMERIEIDEEDIAGMNLRFPEAPRSGQVVVEGKKVVKTYGDKNILNGVDVKLDRGDRVAFVGQNGQGKTTLAKMIVKQVSITAGDITLGHNVSIGYYAQNQSDVLDPSMTLLQTMEQAAPPEMRTRLRNILGAFLFSGEDADKKVSVLSGGERARLALACMLLRPFNLLVLDEPTNHLDIISKDILKQALLDYDGTIIVVSHDREFLAGLTNRTIEFRDRQLFDYIGDVNAFLEKRALNNMRDVELSQKNGKLNGNSNGVEKKEVNFDDRKRLQRNVSNAEKAIERLETEISQIETKMADVDFYNKPESKKIMDSLDQKRKTLEEAMQTWEVAQLELEEVGD